MQSDRRLHVDSVFVYPMPSFIRSGYVLLYVCGLAHLSTRIINMQLIALIINRLNWLYTRLPSEHTVIIFGYNP